MTEKTDCIEQTRSANDIVLEARELIAAAELLSQAEFASPGGIAP